MKWVQEVTRDWHWLRICFGTKTLPLVLGLGIKLCSLNKFPASLKSTPTHLISIKNIIRRKKIHCSSPMFKQKRDSEVVVRVALVSFHHQIT